MGINKTTYALESKPMKTYQISKLHFKPKRIRTDGNYDENQNYKKGVNLSQG